jgi:hypothetical protein
MDFWGKKMVIFSKTLEMSFKAHRKRWLEMRKKVKRSPPSPKGSRRGHPIAWFALLKLKKGLGSPLRDPLGDMGFFTFFLISNHLLGLCNFSLF